MLIDVLLLSLILLALAVLIARHRPDPPGPPKHPLGFVPNN